MVSGFNRGRESLKDETHPERPQTAVVPETVAVVERLLRQDGRMTYSMMLDSIKIGSAALHTILHENLQVQKVQHVNWCQFMLQKFNEGKSKWVYDIVIGDESWIYQSDPEPKLDLSR